MGKSMVPSIERLADIERRQRVRKWNRFYEAAICATREEAPPASNCSQIDAPKFGRTLHALSDPEAAVLLLLLYAPTVEEALDQYALPTSRRLHFLDESPFADGRLHPAYEGTVAAAEELGVIKFHAKIPDYEKGRYVPFPYVGDVLVFHRKGESVEVVNLTIKQSLADFDRPFQAGKKRRNLDREYEKERARHAIEERCHLDAGIRTVRVTGDEIPKVLKRNLDCLNGMRTIPEEISKTSVLRVFDRLLEAKLRCQPPISVFREALRRWDIPMQHSRVIFADAIFSRELRIDLFHDMLLSDKPLVDEQRDALDLVKRWLD